MVAIVFPTSSDPTVRAAESAGRLVNAYVEKTLTGAPGPVLWKKVPGLQRITLHASNHSRGFLQYDQLKTLWALDNKLVRIDQPDSPPGYTFTDIGVLPGTGPVTMARNNAVTPQVVAVATNDVGVGIAYQIDPATGTVTAYSSIDTDLPAGPTSVCSLGGYFVFSYADGRVFASDLNTTAVNALSFNTEQDNPVRRVVAFGGRLYAFGSKWTGVYRNAGTVPFPFLREATIPRGILGTHAIAGWEPGWANELIWVGDDYIVYKLNGLTPVAISTEAVARQVRGSISQGLFGPTRTNVVAFVHMHNSQAFWTLTAKALSAANSWTWEYNVPTGQWHERKSFGIQGWRGHTSVRTSEEWIIGDRDTGALWRPSDFIFNEHTDPIEFKIESGVMSGFPLRVIIPRASFNITAGVGGPTPIMNISWSLNGGAVWGTPVQRAFGAAGETKFNPTVINSGLSYGQGIRYRLESTAAVPIVLAGVEIADNKFQGYKPTTRAQRLTGE